MTDRLETRVADALNDLVAGTHADEEFVGRLLAATMDTPVDRRKQRTVWPALSTAATILAVALVVTLVVRPSSHRSTPQLHSGHITSAPVSPTKPPPVEAALQVCTVPMPDAWIRASKQVSGPADPAVASTTGLTVLTMTPAGDAITFSNVVDAQSDGALVLVQPDGATRVLYSLPPSQVGQRETAIKSAQTDGRWVVFDLVDSSGIRTSIRALNLVSRTVLDIWDARPATQISAPQLLNGSAYWGEVGVNTPSAGHIYGYQLASGHRRTVDSGEVINPTVLGGALEWTRGTSPQWLGTPHLPSGYPINAGKPYALAQQGTTAAWTDWDQSGADPLPTVMIQQGNNAVPRTAYRGTQAPDDAAHQPQPFALTGNYLIYTDGANLLALDLRTGAAIQIVPYDPDFVRAAAANGTLAINTLGAKGGSHLALLRPSDLPEPHC